VWPILYSFGFESASPACLQQPLNPAWEQGSAPARLELLLAAPPYVAARVHPPGRPSCLGSAGIGAIAWGCLALIGMLLLLSFLAGSFFVQLDVQMRRSGR
jgi:hypothetical protein